MKLLLINPSKYDEEGKLMKFKYAALPPVNLLILAALLKHNKQIKITIIDEFIDNIPFDNHFDLVGITTLFTSTFPRVIDISKEFRKRSIPVVLGGTHSTCNTEECMQYADSIVVGEAEGNFEHLIDDFLTNKKIKNIYNNDTFVDLSKFKRLIPDYNLVNLNKYMKFGLFNKSNYLAIEASRGCPMLCTYCTVE